MAKKVIIKTEIEPDRLKQWSTFNINNGIGSNGIFNVYPGPTANCQICSMAGFASIFGYIDPMARERATQPVYIPTRKGSKKMKINDKWYNEDGTAKIQYDKNAFMKIVQAGIRNGGANKAQMLIDVRYNKNYIDFIDKELEKDIVFKQPYTSTNGSKMVMYLIRTNSILRYK